MAPAGAHRMDPGQSQQKGGGDGGGGGAGGACEHGDGGAACRHRACGCRMGSPEMPKDSARTRTREGEGLSQSGAGRVLARDWSQLQQRCQGVQ